MAAVEGRPTMLAGGASARRRWTHLVVASGVAAAVAVIVVAVLAGSRPETVLGSGDPGWVVRSLDPLVRLVVDLAATVCLGSLSLVTFFTRPQRSGSVTPSGYAALRTAVAAAWVWAGAAIVMVALDAADQAGLPLRRVLTPSAMMTLTGVLEAPRAWLVTAGCALVVAIGTSRTVRWLPAVGLCGIALLAVLPPLVVGHSASDAGHDLSTSAVMLHVPAAMVWLGTLVALVRARRLDDRAAALRRYRRLSGGCALLVAGSGVVDGLVLAPGTSAWTTAYGGLLLAKVAAVTALGLIVFWLRFRSPVPADGRLVARLLAAEVVLLAASVAVSVGLSHLPAPKFVGRAVTGEQTLLGFDLSHPPTALALLADWRVDVLFAPLSGLLAAVYLLQVGRLRRRGRAWPRARTWSWLAGCAVLLVASSSGLARYAAAMFSLQMVAHMLIGMLAPILFALGAPLTLIGTGIHPVDQRGLPSLWEWVEAMRVSAVARTLTHPVVAATTFAAAPFLLFLTVAFDLSVRYHWAHLAADAVFLVVGYLFAWVIVGVDPLPRPVSNLTRLVVLLAVMPSCIVFGAAVLGSARLLGDGYASANLYSALKLPWVPDLVADQRLGGYLAVVLAEAFLLPALAVLVVRWGRATGGDDETVRVLVEQVARRRSLDGTHTAQPQAVEHHQQRRGGHGGTGDERVEQPRGGDG